MTIARYFVLVSATLVTCGWALSSMGFLAPWGYLALGPLVFMLLLKLCPAGGSGAAIKWRLRTYSFRKPLPAIFFSISALSFVGGLLHAPSNYDYLTYRLSRLLHWQHQGSWHWISTANDRMNYSGVNAEWLMAPLLFFTDSDRLLFLPNIVCFFLLPAATFAVFHGMGIGKRTAWIAMWTVPTAYCYVAQAGGTGNDLLGAGYFVFSLSFAMRARTSCELGWLFLSALSIALCTGTKATNLPLVLPWLAVATPAMLVCKEKKTLKLIAIAITCVAVSLAPIVFATVAHSRDSVLGVRAEEKLRAGSVAGGVAGNLLAITVGAMQPPLLPVPAPANAALAAAIPDTISALLSRDFPRLKLKFVELANEENAGLGIGLTLLVSVTLIACVGKTDDKPCFNGVGRAVLIFLLAALVSYMALAASESAARLLSPYYLVLLGMPFALARTTSLHRRKWWRAMCVCCAASALPIPILTPSRPIVPVLKISEHLPLPFALTERVRKVYEVYSNRSDNLAIFRDLLPKHAECIGFVSSGDDIEVSLWRPFCSQRYVRHVDPARPLPPELDSLLVSSLAVEQLHGTQIDKFRKTICAQPGWKEVASRKIVSKVQQGPVEWTLFLRESISAGDTMGGTPQTLPIH